MVETYNVGSGEGYKGKELVKMMLKIPRLSGETRVSHKGDLSWSGDIQKAWADITKLKKLGFAPKVGFEKGLEKFISRCNSEHRKIIE